MDATRLFRSALCAQLGSTQDLSSAEVTIHINADKKAAFSTPRTIFGSFLEPIGNSTYNKTYGPKFYRIQVSRRIYGTPRTSSG